MNNSYDPVESAQGEAVTVPVAVQEGVERPTDKAELLILLMPCTLWQPRGEPNRSIWRRLRLWIGTSRRSAWK